MDVDQMVNQEEELDYDENDVVAQNEKNESVRNPICISQVDFEGKFV